MRGIREILLHGIFWRILVIEMILLIGSVFYRMVSQNDQYRNHIAALDTATGEATTWNPNANLIVRALAVSGGIVYAGGNFKSIGGQGRNRIAALEAATGEAVPGWNPVWALSLVSFLPSVRLCSRGCRQWFCWRPAPGVASVGTRFKPSDKWVQTIRRVTGNWDNFWPEVTPKHRFWELTERGHLKN